MSLLVLVFVLNSRLFFRTRAAIDNNDIAVEAEVEFVSPSLAPSILQSHITTLNATVGLFHEWYVI